MFATENANLREKISISHSVVKFLMTNRIACRRNFEKYDHLVPMYYIGWILIRNHENQDKMIFEQLIHLSEVSTSHVYLNMKLHIKIPKWIMRDIIL